MQSSRWQQTLEEPLGGNCVFIYWVAKSGMKYFRKTDIPKLLFDVSVILVLNERKHLIQREAWPGF